MRSDIALDEGTCLALEIAVTQERATGEVEVAVDARTDNSPSSFSGTAKEIVNRSGNPSKPCPRIKLLSQRTQNQPSAPPA